MLLNYLFLHLKIEYHLHDKVLLSYLAHHVV